MTSSVARRHDRPALTIVLDADGVSKLARRDHRVRAMVDRGRIERDGVVVVPWVAVIQALVEGVGARALDQVLDASEEVTAIDRIRTVLAAEHLRSTSTKDIADALVVVEALLRVPAVIITSDRHDIQQLVDADRRGREVLVWTV